MQDLCFKSLICRWTCESSVNKYGLNKTERDYCEKWVQDGSGIKWMEDLTKCTMSKCPINDKISYKKYLEWLTSSWKSKPNMTTCTDVVYITGMTMHGKPFFQHCLDNLLYLLTDLGPEPSAEECEAVDNMMYQRIQKDMGWGSAGRYRKVNHTLFHT